MHAIYPWSFLFLSEIVYVVSFSLLSSFLFSLYRHLSKSIVTLKTMELCIGDDKSRCRVCLLRAASYRGGEKRHSCFMRSLCTRTRRYSYVPMVIIAWLAASSGLSWPKTRGYTGLERWLNLLSCYTHERITYVRACPVPHLSSAVHEIYIYWSLWYLSLIPLPSATKQMRYIILEFYRRIDVLVHTFMSRYQKYQFLPFFHASAYCEFLRARCNLRSGMNKQLLKWL